MADAGAVEALCAVLKLSKVNGGTGGVPQAAVGVAQALAKLAGLKANVDAMVKCKGLQEVVRILGAKADFVKFTEAGLAFLAETSQHADARPAPRHHA